MNHFTCLLLILLATFAGAASAQDEGLRLAPAPVNRLDDESLQRGARDFVNYCLTCHSAQYMRYNRLTDLGLTEAQITDNLMFATDKIGQTMTVAMKPADGQAVVSASGGPARRSRPRSSAAKRSRVRFSISGGDGVPPR